MPAPWTTTRFGTAGNNYPEYTLDAIFGTLASDIELSAFSTGNDLMPPINPDGSLDMTDLWFGLSVSVTNGSTGSSGSHIERLVNAGEAPGAEVFTYYAEGSVGLDPTLVHTTTSERSRESLGLPATQPGSPGTPTEIDGLDFIKRVRARPELAEVPILMVTAMEEKEVLKQAFDEGANDFISKPLEPVELNDR